MFSVCYCIYVQRHHVKIAFFAAFCNLVAPDFIELILCPQVRVNVTILPFWFGNMSEIKLFSLPQVISNIALHTHIHVNLHVCFTKYLQSNNLTFILPAEMHSSGNAHHSGWSHPGHTGILPSWSRCHRCLHQGIPHSSGHTLPIPCRAPPALGYCCSGT